MKIVINKCFGGFGLSKEAYEFLGLTWDSHGDAFDDVDKRANIDLVKCVEKLGKQASGDWADLKVIEIPDNVEWTIKNYDGIERVVEI